ncbi:MAG: hypothetical protein KDB27_31555 [Planctomycetales bacterium]|nr:hypothetical protein [Planctomycetales bacterium]
MNHNMSNTCNPKRQRGTSQGYWLSCFVALCASLWIAQGANAQIETDKASVTTSIGSDGQGAIIVEAHGQLPKPPVFHNARAHATAAVGPERIVQTVQLTIKVVQGEAETLSFGLNGDGQVVKVEHDNIKSWAVRQSGNQRFLDLHLKDNVTELAPTITIQSAKYELPATINLTHLTPGEAVGFDSTLEINFGPGTEGSVVEADGFAPLRKQNGTERFQTSTGGQLTISVNRDGASPAPVELVGTALEGELHPNGKSIQFVLRTTARVTEGDSEITILSGNAAPSKPLNDANLRLRLANENQRPTYKLHFAETGSYPITLEFVALLSSDANWQSVDFTIAASAVVPMTLSGLDSDLQFHRDQQSIVPLRQDGEWLGFLPATGRARLHWKAQRKTGEGKLVFTTTGKLESMVGVGLLRQDHQIDYRVLQGELKAFSIGVAGPGEILDVRGDNIVGWNVVGEGNNRQLDVTLSQPITATSQLNIRSQTPLDAFPVRVEGMRLNPIGAIRHSGHLRLTNLGSVRIEPTDLAGLTQLSPDQFPGDAIEARQIYVYRFPAADHSFVVAADRVQPEVNIVELVFYQLAETDRAIRADVELDIREAPIRDWTFEIPADYSVVSVTGAAVNDYIPASEEADGRRNLRVIFGDDVIGRQLVTLQLEKNEAATAGNWELPRIDYPNAKTVRGDIGVVGSPGFRIAVGATNLLVEKPLSYFPTPMPNLQQAFRVREPDWSATMTIELLDRSVQADVFHLYSLSQATVYGSALINYFVTGSPVSEWRVVVPEDLGNVTVDGQNIRTWRRDGDTLIVALHQPVMGPYTLLVTFEEKPNENDSSFRPGKVAPQNVQGERGYVQVVSPVQVQIDTLSISDDMLALDALELPTELRLLSTAPPLGTWQYTDRPFDLNLKVNSFRPGTTVGQVVEFSEANSQVSKDGELVTDVLYYVKTRGQRSLRIQLPEDPVRLWEVTVNGQTVTARRVDDATLIPLPGGTDPNVPIEVRLRLGKPVVSERRPELTLPVVFAPVLKTQWNVAGDEKHVLVPGGGTVTPTVPVLRPTGFDWVARRGLARLTTIALFGLIGIWASRKNGVLRVLGLVGLTAAIVAAAGTSSIARDEIQSPAPLQLSLPVLSAGDAIELQVRNIPAWQASVSWLGIIVVLAGIGVLASSLSKRQHNRKLLYRCGGFLGIALGILACRDSACWFYGLLAVSIFVLFFLPAAFSWMRDVSEWNRRRAEEKANNADDENSGPDAAVITTAILFMACLFATVADQCVAATPNNFDPADVVTQQWQISHQDLRLSASGTIELAGRPGDQFVLLRAPAVLTKFDGHGLRLTKKEIDGIGLTYIVSIPAIAEANDVTPDNADRPDSVTSFRATFEYQLEAIKPVDGMPVLTGSAAVQQIELTYDESGWDVVSAAAVRVESIESDEQHTKANVLLGPGNASISLKPKARDVTTEETQFFVEASNLYLPGPGVVDGLHRIHIRAAQGQVRELKVVIPSGFTVSDVNGPVGSWQFDADSGALLMEVEPQSQPFDIIVQTQRGLDPLPVDVTLAPLRVDAANGEVGMVAIAFGADAQPERIDATNLSEVNLGDFDRSLIPENKAVLHRVYRYGTEAGELSVRVTPVAPEVRVLTKQVLSLGDERVVLQINFSATITRAGLFQLSFPLPDGLEVESLTGAALDHWSELTADNQRQIVLHLNGKTLGAQQFSLTLAGAAPTDVTEWEVPRFQLTEATRQTGDLVVQPTTGIRLRTITRQNVSETDPRTMGAKTQGGLAFRLLQQDWNLVLGIEKLEPWVTGHVLHEVTLREGQTRSTLLADFNVQNASIRSLSVVLPITNEDEIKTLRATGETVSDFVRTSANSNTWELRLKRRVVGDIQFRIEYERRGDRSNETEPLTPAGFPDARQLSYHFAIRPGGRLEIDPVPLPAGWQQADWNSVPQPLRDSGNHNAPALTLQATTPANALNLKVTRHALAGALKLRVAEGLLTTVLSPTGDQLTAVDLTMEVIQRSSLSITLPDGGDLFSIFVNGESVHSIRQSGGVNAWQFYILPGIDDRTAEVRFVYSLPGERLNRLQLTSPELNVPLENITWNVISPKGFRLADSDGNLELTEESQTENYDRESYLSKMDSKRQVMQHKASELLVQANKLLQAGEQAKARWALNSVANRYALDAASNEDARVQLENLQRKQAVVGLNTRRQRLYLDNKPSDTGAEDNDQLLQAAADNPILQKDQLNFRPQEYSQLLRGNTTEDTAILEQIAGRLVRHQRTTGPAPQAIVISLPEEGNMYTFKRSVQVSENAPLELDLRFDSVQKLGAGKSLAVLLILAGLTLAFTIIVSKKSDEGEELVEEAAVGEE